MINEYFSPHISIVERSVLVKATGCAFHLFSYKIVPLLVSLLLDKPLCTIVILTINEETFSSKLNAFF